MNQLQLLTMFQFVLKKYKIKYKLIGIRYSIFEKCAITMFN